AALLGMALRANGQVGDTKQVGVVVQALVDFRTQQKVAAGEDKDRAAESAALDALKQGGALTRKQVEELTARKDEKGLKSVKEGTPPILDDLAKRRKSANPEFTLWHAQGLLTVDQPEKAAEMLEKVPEPGPNAGEEEVKWHRSCRLMQ